LTAAPGTGYLRGDVRLFRGKRDPKLERLASVPLFEGIDDRELKELAPLVEEVDVRAGKVLMTEGRPAWECFIVSRGQGRVEVRGERVGTVAAGEVLGEMALMGDGLRSATVTADEDMHVFVTDRRGFREMMRHTRVASRVEAARDQRAAATPG
jgi:CRP-like cAMP-binding protein